MEWLIIFIVAVGIIAFVEWKTNTNEDALNPFEVVKKRIITKKKTRKRTAKAKSGTTKTTRKKATKKKVKLGGGNRRK